jgi:cysteine desulfurase
VMEAMLPYLLDLYGNAGSAHALGRPSEAAVQVGRERVAALLGCGAGEVVFNSGGTEGLNHVFRGVFEAFPEKRHLVTTTVEHPAVRTLCEWLLRQGVAVTSVAVDGEGRLDLGALEAALRQDTALVSVMAANNETGVRFPLERIAEIVKAKGILFHVDATQAIGKVPLDLTRLPVDLLNLSAHKFHGPKGVGALFIRRGLRLKPFQLGGGQERGRRGGTENVAGIAGLGAAAALALELLPDMARVEALRDRLESTLAATIEGLRFLGGRSPRLPNTTLQSYRGLEGEALLLRLDQAGICVSTGSACATGRKEASHVLQAMAVPDEYAKGTIRVSLSRYTREDEIGTLEQLLPGIVAELRDLNPFHA